MPALRCWCAAIATLSRHVRVAKSRMFWNVRETPRQAIAQGRDPSIGAPSSRTCPSVGV